MNTNYAEICDKLVDFLKREVEIAGFERVVFGLSGGVDSATVALLCKRAFGHNILAVLMPSDSTNPKNTDDALALTEKYDIETEVVPIKNMIAAYPLELTDKVRRGNLSARLRMLTLYDISNRDKRLVIGTSNKSEIILGYGTIFGDTACALNPIGELYKTQIFGLAAYLGVTEAILTKAPSADLWEGQSDEDELGHKYKDLDAAMFELFDKGVGKDAVISAGHDTNMVELIFERYSKNSFKSKPPKIAAI